MSVGILYVLSAIGFVSERWFDTPVEESGSLDPRSCVSSSNATGWGGARGQSIRSLGLAGSMLVRVGDFNASTLVGVSCSLRKAQPRRSSGARVCTSESPPEAFDVARSVVVVPVELMFGLNIPNVDLQ